MKRTIQAAVIVLLVVTAGAAGAQDTATVTVTARVLGTCQFSAAGATLGFGDLPFTAAGIAQGRSTSTTLNFWCTSGAAYTITDDDGLYETGLNLNRMQSTTLGAPEYIDYTLTYNPATGTGLGPGTPITLTIDGTVGATYTNNSPDSYTDTVTLTINP